MTVDISYISLLMTKPVHEAAVVIPVYKTTLTEYETISLDRCLKILGKYDIFIVSPEGLSLDQIRICNENVRQIFFEKGFFENVSGYNRLMLGAEFYKSFIEYRYILIHQLDAFVFSDQLLEWCKLSFDYIGAPWINVETLREFKEIRYGPLWPFLGKRERDVGNGGFSLRKTRSFLLALMCLNRYAQRWQTEENEDLFWSFVVPDYLPFFKIPVLDIAVKFSCETEPRFCLEKNNGLLPFGCHAWEKYDLELWRPIFHDLGYCI